MTNSLIAVIVDIVRSRELADVAEARLSLRAAFDASASVVEPVQHLTATVGDEFQLTFADIAAAMNATAIVRLMLPEHIQCRFGFGAGVTRDIEVREDTTIRDGSAWWNAREAIDECHRREDKKNPYLRGWFVTEPDDVERAALVNSFLLLRDSLIDSMRPREKRVMAGLLQGMSQAELAATEQITQSAVSQSLYRSGGAALLAAQELFAASAAAGADR